MSISLAPTATVGDPLLNALLAQVPRLRRELPGWTPFYLIPCLQAFTEDATDAQLAAALENLCKVLRSRAASDSWLGDIARLSHEASAGNAKAWCWPTDLEPRIELSDRTKNRTIVEQARRLVAELTAPPSAKEEGAPTPPTPRPDDR